MILNAIQAGDGPPVVFLHGLFGAARNFGGFQRALAARCGGSAGRVRAFVPRW